MTQPSLFDLDSPLRIVSRSSGSWRWQSAYGVVEYRPIVTRDGRRVWRSHNVHVRKASLPQLRRMGYGDLPMGSLHNRPVL